VRRENGGPTWTATTGFTALEASQWWRRRWGLRLLLHRGGDCWPGVRGTRRRREIEGERRRNKAFFLLFEKPGYTVVMLKETKLKKT